MSSLENRLILTYLLWFSTRIQMEKNWGDTPSATLNLFVTLQKSDSCYSDCQIFKALQRSDFNEIESIYNWYLM